MTGNLRMARMQQKSSVQRPQSSELWRKGSPCDVSVN